MLATGTKAPDFTLQDQDGKLHSLKDFAGKKVILYFYPKDMTPGCTVQAQLFAKANEEFVRRGIQVIGISKDSAASHAKFAQKYDLPFLLLSDPDLATIQAYDLWKQSKLYGKSFLSTQRSTYLIDEHGLIQQGWPKVDPSENVQQILDYLDKQQTDI